MFFYIKIYLQALEIKLMQQKMIQLLKMIMLIAVSLNKVPEIPSIKINGRKTATKIKVVAIIANEICLDPL